MMNIRQGFEVDEKTKHPCPVCEQTWFPFRGCGFSCQICGWEDDLLQYDDHDYAGGQNELSVNENRRRWKMGLKTK